MPEGKMKKHQTKNRFACILMGMAIPVAAAVLISLKFFTVEHEGCTSWAAIGNALDPDIRGRKVILHKNRDGADTLTMSIREIKNGTCKYLAIAGHEKDSAHPTDDNILVYAGVNEAGLAAASNYVGGFNVFGTMGGADFCREILENCRSVDAAYRYITSRKLKFRNGNLIFLADPARVAVVEVKTWFLWFVMVSSKARSIVDGSAEKPNVVYRSNHYINLPNCIFIPLPDDTIARYNRLTGFMNSTNGSLYGAINVEQSRAVSRLEKKSGNDAFCKSGTLARMTIEIDTANPLESIIWYGPGYDKSRADDEHCSDEDGNLVAYTFSR
jgi:hypothetical protein